MNNIIDSSNMFKSIYDFSSNIESAFEIGEKIMDDCWGFDLN